MICCKASIRAQPAQTSRRSSQRLRARHIAVVLVGIAAPPAIGRAYAQEFDGVFTSTARADRVPIYPDLLAGVSANNALKQRDGIHPNAAGVAVIAERLAPVIARTLKARR